MGYYQEEIMQYDIVIPKGRYFSLVIDDDEITNTWQFRGSIENRETQADLVIMNVDYSQVVSLNRITFYLSSVETEELAESDTYIYDIKYKTTADATSDWLAYAWGYCYVKKTVTP